LNARGLIYNAAGAPRAPWRILFFVALSTLVGAVASLVLMPFEAPFVSGGLRNDIISGIVGVVGALGGSWIMLRFMDRKPLSEIGLHRAAANPTRIGAGFALGGLAIGLPIVVLIAVGWLRNRPSVIPLSGHPLLSLTVMLLAAAFSEELITRGYVLTVLRDAWGWPAAVAVTSVAFGLLHLGNAGVTIPSILNVMLAGVFLAAIRIAFDSLYAAWAAHFAWNWVMAVGFHAAVSGYVFATPGYRYVDAGPDWATGGVWGPEGGIPADVAMIIATGLLLARLNRRRKGELLHG
jgi:membrane protease YdiL (CAAX protease family)